ncbi:MAG TPA: 7-carboxy-7-deazaguanine synthase QueE [Abditibacteriaceae bacterium]|jgi:7-carboxy-7-deazaguanine synthase
MANQNKKLVISEIFGPVLQGEGALIGRPTLFVRTGGCDFRCQWCDTLYAVLPQHRADWTKMAVQTILARLDELSRGVPMLVTLSGGNPALQPLDNFICEGQARGYTFALETQGSIARDWFSQLDYLVLSPKPPSSQMPFDETQLHACISAAQKGNGKGQISLKVVVFNDADYEFARRVHLLHPQIPFYLQVGNTFSLSASQSDEVMRSELLMGLEKLSERVLSDSWHNVTVLPQMHVLIHGNRRGV